MHRWVDPLNEDQFWRNPFSYGNSVGHLVLHLTGNLSYYIGAQIAGTGYVRNRDLEFCESRRPAKVEVLRRFDETIAMVVATIEAQSEDGLEQPPTLRSGNPRPKTGSRSCCVARCICTITWGRSLSEQGAQRRSVAQTLTFPV